MPRKTIYFIEVRDKFPGSKWEYIVYSFCTREPEETKEFWHRCYPHREVRIRSAVVEPLKGRKK